MAETITERRSGTPITFANLADLIPGGVGGTLGVGILQHLRDVIQANLDGANLTGVVQTPADVLTSSGNAVALVMTGANKKTLALGEDTTITVSAEVADQSAVIWITQTGAGGTAAWSGVDKWLGGSAPVLTVTIGSIDIIVLESATDGTTIVGMHLGVAS